VSRRAPRSAASLGLLLLGLAFGASPAWGQASWRLEQPPPPAGAVFKTALGPPGDLQCFAPNRCLLGVEGNAAIPRGIFSWNGRSWHQLSTVCGGSGDTMRIAFAGPTEFWTISEPSRPRFGAGTALCRFLNGQVVASYSTPVQSPDPFRQMFAATCLGPANCWFGGIGSQDPTGERVGAFHLHWNGSGLVTVYNRGRGRAVSDLQAHQGEIWETLLAGRRPESSEAAELSPPESDGPAQIHEVEGEPPFPNDPFRVAPRAGVPDEGSELLALDSDGSQLWAVGGGAASGSAVPVVGDPPEPDPPVRRPPLAVRRQNGQWQELPLPDDAFRDTERFVDVAAVAGTSYAWAALQPFDERASVNARAKVAQIGADGSVSITRLPVGGAGRGSAARIEFSGPGEGWLVTQGGWLFHYTDGTVLPQDTDPAYQGTITFRPNEAAEQFVPDTPPVDDSLLFAPPPVEVTEEEPRRPRTRRLPALLRKIRSRVRGTLLIVSFTLTRRARVALIARRNGRVVARTRPRLMRPGRRSLRLRLDVRRWPTRLSFSAREPGRRRQSGGGQDGDTIVTGRAVAPR
jgi:hypothetical protein